jgi:hypothetical protein
MCRKPRAKVQWGRHVAKHHMYQSAEASTRILGVHTYACGIGVRLRQVLNYPLARLAARGTYPNLYFKFPLGFY